MRYNQQMTRQPDIQADGEGARTMASEPHDHSTCAGHGSELEHVKLTPSRQVILDILCEHGAPLGAYDLIDRIAEKKGKRPAPISVYRVLDYLVEHGLAHRLSSRNAFLACMRHHDDSAPHIFMICDQCGSVSEETSSGLVQAMDVLADLTQFKPRSQMIELAGLCAQCHSQSTS